MKRYITQHGMNNICSMDVLETASEVAKDHAVQEHYTHTCRESVEFLNKRVEERVQILSSSIKNSQRQKRFNFEQILMTTTSGRRAIIARNKRTEARTNSIAIEVNAMIPRGELTEKRTHRVLLVDQKTPEIVLNIKINGKSIKAILDTGSPVTVISRGVYDIEEERFNRTLEGMLRCFIQDNLSDWDQYLNPLAFAYNTAVHATTGVSPFQMVYGRLPRLPIDLIFPTEVRCQFELEPEDFIKEIRKVFELVAMIRENLI